MAIDDISILPLESNTNVVEFMEESSYSINDVDLTCENVQEMECGMEILHNFSKFNF